MENIQNWVQEDDEQRSWRNTNTGTILGILPEEDGDGWIVTGQNSRIHTADTLENAREYALEWMQDHPKPSPMV